MFKRTSLMALIIGCLAFTTVPTQKVEAAGYKSKSSYMKSPSRTRSAVRSRSAYTPYNRSRSSSVTQPKYRMPQSQPRPVIQKNYYQSAPRNYGGGMGGGGGAGLGTSILGGAAGAVGGMMLYNALSGPSSGDKALQMQKEERIIQDAKEEQARDDKLERIEQKLDAQQAPALIPPQDPFYQLGGQK